MRWSYGIIKTFSANRIKQVDEHISKKYTVYTIQYMYGASISSIFLCRILFDDATI